MTEINRDVFEALSSETRAEILKELGRRGTTPTYLSQILGKHKSTIVEHLKVLQNSGLVKREAIEGRKRVIYSLTQQGKRLVIPQTTVTLILSTTIISFVLGIGAFVTLFLNEFINGNIPRITFNQPEMLIKSMNVVGDAMVQGGTKSTQLTSNCVPFLYIGLILVTIGLLSYSYWKRKK